ncbi:MAG: Cas10/Cmr2 second palm domain-containing protein [bacterium]
MSEYLLVAEADKIQDLLFRSSKLREVVGGSQLLKEFCEKGVNELIKKGDFDVEEEDIIIQAGGTVEILFNKKNKAKEFSEYLSELYRRTLGGSITIADILKIDRDENKEKFFIKKSQTELRKAKHIGKKAEALQHNPYIALCSSCGIGLAEDIKSQEGQRKYICKSCLNKKNIRNEKIKKGFLNEFSKYVSSDFDNLKNNYPEDTDEIATLNSKNYVAYLIADVNYMGKVFNSCNDFKMVDSLSENFNRIIQESLAEPLNILLHNQNIFNNINFNPVLPLILGGDDIFVLLPANWALDYTIKFFKEFETRIAKYLEKENFDIDYKPTISAGLVICKGKYPYYSAHRAGNELLKQAKRKAKTLEKDKIFSTISYKIITGNTTVKEMESEENKFKTGYCAYKVEELEQLLDFRLKLKNLPGTRRNQIQDIFIEAEKRTKNNNSLYEANKKWKKDYNSLLDRLNENIEKRLKQFEHTMDISDETGWHRENGKYYHPLSGLLSAWDYSYKLKYDMKDYRRDI